MLSGSTRLRLPSHMKNFVRLVQFAWRYRVRFGLSIGCAAMVALLFFTELGAVYPLLHILFDSQNPKRWVAEKITSIEDEIVFLECGATEAGMALQFAESKQRDYEVLRTRYEALHKDYVERESELLEQQRMLGVTELKENVGQPLRNELPELDLLRQAVRLADTRLKELRECRRVLEKSGAPGICGAFARLRRRKRSREGLVSVQVSPALYRPLLAERQLQEPAAADGAGDDRGGLQGLLHVPAGDAGRLGDAAHALRHPQRVLPADDQPRPRELLATRARPS